MRDVGNRLHSFRKSELKDLDKEFGKSLMPSFRGRLSDAEIEDLVAYSVQSERCQMRWAILITIALGPLNAFAQVPYQRIAAAESEPASWLTYSGNYQSQRFSPLTQINRQNVGAAEAGVDLPGAADQASSKRRRSSRTA